MEEFDYGKAVAELEEIAGKVEDPSTGLDDVGKYISRASELIEKCRAWLRGARESLDKTADGENI